MPLSPKNSGCKNRHQIPQGTNFRPEKKVSTGTGCSLERLEEFAELEFATVPQVCAELLA
jgi:hypothetical protein